MTAKDSSGQAQPTLSYRVERAPGGWSVARADACLGVFADPAEAVDIACRAARDDAGRDQVAIVTAQTSPQELHCFVPAQGQAASGLLPTDLRLLVDNAAAARPDQA